MAVTPTRRVKTSTSDGTAQTDVEQMVHYVSPTSDQLDWDEDGPVDRSLFVWATDASEAIKLWHAYYEENRPRGY